MKRREIKRNSADFKYEFKESELWNIGHNFDKILLQGLKQYSEKIKSFLDEPELLQQIDNIMILLEYNIEHAFDFDDQVSKNNEIIHKVLGKINCSLWY